MNETHRTDREAERDRRFAERVSENYQPQAFDPARRARCAAELRDRIHGRHRAPIWIPALVGTAAALALVWWASPLADLLAPAERTPSQVASSPESSPDWETDVLRVDANVVVLEEEYLPADYEAIALAFIDGV